VTDISQNRVVGVFLTAPVNPATTGPSPTPAVSGPAAGVPGEPLTCTLTATETDAAADAVYTYHVDWVGNGSVTQTVTGPSGMTVTHVYPTTGNFTIKVKAVDPAGDASTQTATQAVSITPTALVNDPATNTETALAIGCPLGGETVVISPTNGAGTDVAVSLNGVMPTLPKQPFSHILVFGQTGKVVVQEVTALISGQTVRVAVPAIVIGGTGTNTLSAVGSSANNVLVGGPGSSTLTGGSGRDILIGGGGSAALHAGSGDDILIGGSTTYDANVTALLALIGEWGRTDIGYAIRVQDLFGSGSGGQNGADVLTAQTIMRDRVVNQLFGGAGMDWFWLSENSTSADQLSSYASVEIVSFE
jgi:hypothetical protein